MGGICRARERTFSHHLGCCWTSGSFHRDTAAYALLSSKKAQESSWRSARVGFINSPPTSANCPTKKRPVFGSRVPNAWCALPRGRAVGTSAGQERGRHRRGEGRSGAPAVAGGAATPQWARTWHFRTSRRLRLVCERDGEWTRYAEGAAAGRCPFPGAGAQKDEGRVLRRPWPLSSCSRRLEVSRGRAPAPVPRRASAERECAGPRAAPRSPEGSAPAGCARAEGTPAWESGGREAPAGSSGPWRLPSVRSDSRELGGGGGEAGMWNKASSWVRALRTKVCLGVGRALMWEMDTWIFWSRLCDLG